MRLFKLKTAAAVAFCMATLVHGGVPAENMNAYSLGAEYYVTATGHDALYDIDSTYMWGHQFRLHYAPIPYLRFTGGIGAGWAQGVDGAKAGLLLNGGAGVYSPRLFNLLTITAGYEGQIINNRVSHDAYYRLRENILDEDGEVTGTDTTHFRNEYSGETKGVLHAPYLGVIFHLGRFANFEIGGQWRQFTVSQKLDSLSRELSGDGYVSANPPSHRVVDVVDAVSEQVRLYTSLTLHEKTSGAYFTLGANFAVTDRVEDKSAFGNMSVWGQIGLIMRDNPPAQNRVEGFAEYRALKARQDRMAAAINQDAHRSNRRDRKKNSGRASEQYEDDDSADFVRPPHHQGRRSFDGGEQ